MLFEGEEGRQSPTAMWPSGVWRQPDPLPQWLRSTTLRGGPDGPVPLAWDAPKALARTSIVRSSRDGHSGVGPRLALANGLPLRILDSLRGTSVPCFAQWCSSELPRTPHALKRRMGPVAAALPYRTCPNHSTLRVVLPIKVNP